MYCPTLIREHSPILWDLLGLLYIYIRKHECWICQKHDTNCWMHPLLIRKHVDHGWRYYTTEYATFANGELYKLRSAPESQGLKWYLWHEDRTNVQVIRACSKCRKRVIKAARDRIRILLYFKCLGILDLDCIILGYLYQLK